MEPYEIAALASSIEQAIGTEEGRDDEALDALQEMSEALELASADLTRLRAAVYDASNL